MSNSGISHLDQTVMPCTCVDSKGSVTRIVVFPLFPCYVFEIIIYGITRITSYSLRLDNTGAGVVEVNPSLLGNHTTENIDLYIK